jgi:hypothetical protein
MVNWYWLIVAFIAGSIFTTITDYWFDYENLLTNVLAALAIPFVWLALFPIKFWQNFVHPMTSERWNNILKKFADETGSKYYYLTKNVVLYHDTKTCVVQAKWFLVRIKDVSSYE